MKEVNSASQSIEKNLYNYFFYKIDFGYPLGKFDFKKSNTLDIYIITI